MNVLLAARWMFVRLPLASPCVRTCACVGVFRFRLLNENLTEPQ